MKKRVSDCVDCGLPCLGRACPHNSVELVLCDFCLDNHTETDAEYVLDGIDLCEDCFYDAILNYIKEMTIDELKEKLDLNVERVR